MMWFWIGAVLIAAFLLIPFVFASKQQKSRQAVTQLELNKQIFAQREHELKQQHESGELTEQEFQQLYLELQTSLLDDTAEMEQQTAQSGRVWPLWGLVGIALVVVVLLYARMGNHHKVEQWQQAMNAMPEFAQRLMQPADKPLSNDELELFALALRTKLKENGDDAMGWLLHGRIQLSFGRLNEASESFVNALHLEPQNKSANLSYAKALAMTGEANKINYAKSIYQRLLIESPNDLDVLSEQAFTLFEVGEQQSAIASWRKMLEILPEAHPRHQQIKQTLAMLKSQGHGQVPMAEAEVSQGEPAVEPSAVASGSELAINVEIQVNGTLVLPEQSFLVVYARAVQGPPMPMVIQRMPMPQLPAQVTLSNADAMMKDYQLGAVEPFEVVVKVVESANVATAQSLYEAVSSALNKQDLPANVTLTLESK